MNITPVDKNKAFSDKGYLCPFWVVTSNAVSVVENWFLQWNSWFGVWGNMACH